MDRLPPRSIIGPPGMASPIVAHIPHASTVIPSEVRARLLVSDEALARELVRMTDWHTDTLFAFTGRLGATRLEVATRVVFPAALSGILAAILLAVSRVVGETMIVAIAAGSTPNLSVNPLDSVQTMTGYMLQIGLGDAARGTVDYSSIFAVGSMLFLMTFGLNVGAQAIVRHVREVYD